jgi:uncharacterized protein (TIGR02246 family)
VRNGSIPYKDDFMARRPVLALVALVAISAPVGNAQAAPAEEEPIRALIKTFADARNSHDGAKVAALYSVDGEWISSNGLSVRGRTALARLWGTLTGQVQRTIESIDLAGSSIAVVRVVTQYSDSRGRHHETFVFVKAGFAWEVRIHQTVD